jgi:hypothetical protein
LLPVLLVIALFLVEAADAGREQVLDAQSATAEVVATVLASTLNDNHKMLQELASIDRLRRMDPASAKEALDLFSRALPSIYGLFLVDQHGELVASTGLDPSQFQLHSAFVDAVERSLVLGEPGVSTALTAPDVRVIALTDPVRAKDQAEGEPIGAVGALLSVERLGAAVLPFARGDTLIAVVADGQVVAAQGTDPAVSALAAETVPAPLATTSGPHVYLDQSGQERLAVYAPVPSSNWGVLVTHPSPGAYAPNRQMVNRTAFILAGAALGTLYTVDPVMGIPVLFKAFAIITIGGVGDVRGTTVAALMIGVFESLAGGLGSKVLQDATAFLLMLAVLLLRPQGLFSRSVRL